ncbi:MAG: DUF4224 domain-containing protein [Gammaproteobacteria bacterium]
MGGSDPFLTRSELERLTCRKKARAMIRALDRLNIPYGYDGNGWPLVPRQCVPVFGPNLTESDKKQGPDLDAAFESQ